MANLEKKKSDFCVYLFLLEKQNPHKPIYKSNVKSSESFDKHVTNECKVTCTSEVTRLSELGNSSSDCKCKVLGKGIREAMKQLHGKWNPAAMVNDPLTLTPSFLLNWITLINELTSSTVQSNDISTTREYQQRLTTQRSIPDTTYNTLIKSAQLCTVASVPTETKKRDAVGTKLKRLQIATVRRFTYHMFAEEILRIKKKNKTQFHIEDEMIKSFHVPKAASG